MCVPVPFELGALKQNNFSERPLNTHSLRNRKNKKNSMKWLPTFSFRVTQNEPSSGSTFRKKNGLNCHLQPLKTLNADAKHEKILLFESFNTEDDFAKSL